MLYLTLTYRNICSSLPAHVAHPGRNARTREYPYIPKRVSRYFKPFRGWTLALVPSELIKILAYVWIHSTCRIRDTGVSSAIAILPHREVVPVNTAEAFFPPSLTSICNPLGYDRPSAEAFPKAKFRGIGTIFHESNSDKIEEQATFISASSLGWKIKHRTDKIHGAVQFAAEQQALE